MSGCLLVQRLSFLETGGISCQKKFTRLTPRWKITAYYIYVWAQTEWIKVSFWPEGLLIYRKCGPVLHRVWVPTAGSGSFTGVSGRRGWGCPVPGTADSRQVTIGHTWDPQPHRWHLRESAFKKQKTSESKREPIGETAEETPKSEEEEQPHGKADFPHGDRGKAWEERSRRKELLG